MAVGQQGHRPGIHSILSILAMAEHTVELRPYQGVTKGGFKIDIPHQRQVLVDGVFVGYCPTTRQPIPILGRIPAEISDAVAKAAEEFWNDNAGPATVKMAPAIGDDEDDE